MPLVLGGDRRKIVSRWKKGGVPVDNPYGHLLLEIQPDEYFLLEDGSNLLQEDGSFFVIELIQHSVLLEDGGYILLEFDNVLLENGDNLLLEDGNLILWEA
jgi:urease accessory protein UreE